MASASAISAIETNQKCDIAGHTKNKINFHSIFYHLLNKYFKNQLFVYLSRTSQFITISDPESQSLYCGLQTSLSPNHKPPHVGDEY